MLFPARHRGLAAALAGIVFLLGALAAAAQSDVIADIRWEGLRRIPRDTMNARILTKKGDPYDVDGLKRDLRAVWNTNFFENVSIEVEDTPEGKIVYFIVQERPLIRRIEYDGLKSIPQSDLLEAFRELRVGLTVEMQYDPTRIRRAEVVLKNLLSQRGRHFANVGHDIRRIPPNAVILTFLIDEGPKVKVGKVSFQGNRRFSDKKLKRSMKGSRPMGIPPFFYFLSKTYNGRKVQEDLERIRELYQEHGYYRVIVHPPDSRYRGTKPWLPLRTMPWWFKPGKAVDMRIVLDEGARYRMGELTILNATGDVKDLFFNASVLHNGFPLQKGDIFNVSKIREALENYKKLYSEFGFINMTPLPGTDIDDDARVIDITLEFEENKQFFVHRIEFMGNTTTRDKVIRRQLLLDEGSMFNSRLWELSVLRLNQLGFFEELKPENAEMQQNADQGTVDLTLKVRERGKNSIGLSGGASGTLGSFLGLSYSTNNFLGLGETLNFSFEFGDRQRSFLFGFTEPYLFDRPIQAGFTFFIRRFEFDQARETSLLSGSTFQGVSSIREQLLNFTQNTTGFTLFASYPLKRQRFARIGITYGFDTSDVSCATDACDNLFQQLAFRSIGGRDARDNIRSSRITPSYLYNTTNHPLFPTRGTSIFASTTLEGGPLGGNQKTFRPAFEIKHYRPINRGRNTLAFRLLGGYVTGFGGRVPTPFSRFFIGGEDTIRGFDIRAVSPMAFIPVRATTPIFFFDPTQLDANGNPTLRFTTVEVLSQTVTFPGGDTQLVGNFEYRIPLFGPVTIAPFLDAGLNTILRPSQLRLNTEFVDDLNTSFPNVSLGQQLRLVPGTNAQIRTSSGLEMVINLPVINAPFRVYWAYNLTRLEQAINIPAPVFRVPEGVVVPPGVFESQISPALGATFIERTVVISEPLRTFRFTVSRTF
ncbi:MAG: outer membrane protein assembly factor BamA [Terriglobia bacterium]